MKEALNSFAKSVVTRLIEDKDDTVNPEKIPEFNVAFFNLAEQASLNPQSLHLYIHIYIHVYVCVFVCVCVYADTPQSTIVSRDLDLSLLSPPPLATYPLPHTPHP